MKGVIVATLTPFTAEGGQIDFEGFRNLIDFVVDAGVDGLFVAGTTGEWLHLTPEERMQLADIAVEQAKGRVPVMFHVGAISPTQTVELLNHARACGAEAASVITPIFFPADEQILMAYFEEILKVAKGFPVFLYNNHKYAANDLPPRIVRKLAQKYRGLVGIKDSSGNIQRIEEYLEARENNFTVLTGSDSLIVSSMAVGASGVVSAIANVYPELIVELFRAWNSGNHGAARKKQAEINKLRNLLKSGPYLSPYKEAVAWRGVKICTEMRRPLRAMSPEEREKLLGALPEIGFLRGE